MVINIRGFVLFSVNYRDSDRIITLLTREHGLITCTARKAANNKSAIRSLTLPFVFAEYELFYYRGRYTVNSAQLIEGFQSLASSPEHLTAAAHLAEVYRDLLRDDVPSAMAYELWPYALWQLSKSDDPILTICIAELKLLSALGFAPNLQSEDDKAQFFSLSESFLVVKHDSQAETIRLQSQNISLLKMIPALPIAGLFNTIKKYIKSQSQRDNFIYFANEYLNYTMEKRYTKFDNLRDYQQLKNIADRIKREVK